MDKLLSTYKRFPVTFSHGDGCWLYDVNGKRYLDALAGIAVNTLGHAHPRLLAALREQSARVIHLSNLFEAPLQQELAQELSCAAGSIFPATEVVSNFKSFFCNSGLEANEAMIKLARKYGYKRGIDNPQILVFSGAFHGRSMATISATTNLKIQKGFAPLLEGFIKLPFNDFHAITHSTDIGKNVVAVMIEPIQGEGGIQLADPEFLRNLRALCNQNQWLLLFDEIQCGIGRTGRWFGHQWSEIQPDAMTLAKGLGSGIPIGVMLAQGAAAEVLEPGDHGSTFGGNLLAMRAGITTLSVMKEESLLENAANRGNQLVAGLKEHFKEVSGVVEIRGRGLMIGIELDRPCPALAQQALDAGLILNVTAERVIRLLPPLILSEEQANFIIETLVRLVRQFLSTH